MPNIDHVPRRRGRRGAGVENPHLVLDAAAGRRASFGRAEKKKEQFTLHAMIQSGIVSLLIPVGADPGHTNALKTKNPLARATASRSATIISKPWKTGAASCRRSRRTSARCSAAPRSTKPRSRAAKRSKSREAIWNDGNHFRRLEIAAAQHRKDPAFLKARKRTQTFVDWLYDDADGVVTRGSSISTATRGRSAPSCAPNANSSSDLNMTPGAKSASGATAGATATSTQRNSSRCRRPRRRKQRVARELRIKHLARQRTQTNKEMINCGLICRGDRVPHGRRNPGDQIRGRQRPRQGRNGKEINSLQSFRSLSRDRPTDCKISSYILCYSI